MLSNLASYLLGYGESTPAEVPSDNLEDMRLSTVESEEDDWLLVHTTSKMYLFYGIQISHYPFIEALVK